MAFSQIVRYPGLVMAAMAFMLIPGVAAQSIVEGPNIIITYIFAGFICIGLVFYLFMWLMEYLGISIYGKVRTDQDIRRAVEWWCGDGTRATAGFFYGHISTWDTSAVTNMERLFEEQNCAIRNCLSNYGFNDDISQWNVGNVTNMDHMFYNASAFNQPIGQWNVGNVTNMEGMFQGARAFNQPLGQWNVGNVTNMGEMFSGASKMLEEHKPKNDCLSITTTSSC